MVETHRALPLSFSTEQALKRFYWLFKETCAQFARLIDGPVDEATRQAYALLMLKRLLVLYFLQKQGLLAADRDYLPGRLRITREQQGEDQFYQHIFLPLCHTLLFQKTTDETVSPLFEKIVVLELSIFAPHPLEKAPCSIVIPDEAFVLVFLFFEKYRWSLEPRPTSEGELHPDVLAYLCERELNQTQRGIYYTGSDITAYIASNTIVPYLFTELQQWDVKCIPWCLLAESPDRYMLPILFDASYLVTETEREYQDRQCRYERLHLFLQEGGVRDVTALVTLRLDTVKFACDAIQSWDSPACLLSCYRLLEKMAILDPTCGAGAFLFAALDVLITLYLACLTRMRELLNSHPFSDDNALTRCRTLLADVGSEREQQGFVLAQVITNNLYGVDLMEEAVEICRLRLYFSWLASVSGPEQTSRLSPQLLHIQPGNAVTGVIHPNKTTEGGVRDNAERGSQSVGVFDWSYHFPGVLARGGFDVIIGNPPYVEYSKVRQDYVVQGYEERSYGNLYAAVIERSLALCRVPQAYLGLIVPLSICSGKRFSTLRSTLLEKLSSLWLAHFEIFPSRLFENAFQRLSILLGRRQATQSATVYTTRLHRWYSVERPHLLDLMYYIPCDLYAHHVDVFPKLAAKLQEDIWRKVADKASGQRLADVLVKEETAHFVYYQEATNYWTKVVCHVPFYTKNGVKMPPPHGRFLYFPSANIARAVMALLNSSLFYLWFSTYSDGFHLSQALVAAFPVCFELLEQPELPTLALALEQDIRTHALCRTRNTRSQTRQLKRSLLIELEEFRMGLSKPLLDNIDRVLAEFYGLTTQEWGFVVHYDEKYRMGRENAKDIIV
jgi:hypothetical protein